MLRLNSDEAAIKWLFHRATDGRWRWQKTSIAQGVIAESARSHASYCDCVSEAKLKGYKEWLAPAKLMPLSFSHVPLSSAKKQQKDTAPSRQSASASKPDSTDAERSTPANSNVVALRGQRAT
jgi:hypothetical protein